MRLAQSAAHGSFSVAFAFTSSGSSAVMVISDRRFSTIGCGVGPFMSMAMVLSSRTTISSGLVICSMRGMMKRM